MRYTQTNVESTQLLRNVISRMSQHAAPPNPMTFAVWYEHLSGMNRALSSALDALLESNAPMDMKAVTALYDAHIAPSLAPGVGRGAPAIPVTTDPLTGLLNRAGFEQALAAVMAEAPQSGAMHCLVMLDVDHFKLVNETHGEATGDAVLVALAEVIAQGARSANAACARYEEDQFAVLLNDTTLARARGFTSALFSVVKTTTVRSKGTNALIPAVTVSGGMARMKPTDTAASFIASAELALSHSKNAGRSRLTIA